MPHLLGQSTKQLKIRRRRSSPWGVHGQTEGLTEVLAAFQAELDGLRGGRNATMYQWLGAHLTEHEGVAGTRFAVWAPNAEEVSVINNGNGWTPGQDVLWGSDSGVWSGFIAGFGEGDAYKYAIRSNTGELLEKTDPVGFYFENPPATASICWDVDKYDWNDSDWMIRRASTDWLKRPISVYEVHLGSWKRPKDGRKYFTYAELAKQLVDYCHEMGFTHLELMPITEFPFDGSWGYQATGYFAPTSRFGTPDDFMAFVDYCHRHGVGVIIDWVPAHFPTDAHSLGRFDGTCLYEHSDPRKGYHPDWNTLIFNYGRNEVRDFLLSSARFWLDKYHIDGLRVDAVASMLYLDYSRNDGEWIPNQFGGRENLEAIQFLKDMNVELHGQFPGVMTIAEESTSWGGVSHPVYNGGLGFSMKWDMGWMNDTLSYMSHEPVHRSYHQNELSFRMVYAFTENFVLPLSHDEVVHGKKSLLSQMPGDYWQQFANLRMLYGYQYTMPGKKLLFMGCEFGQWTEWNHDSELDWSLFGHEYHDGLRLFIGDLNHFYKSHRALFEADFDWTGFTWIQADDWQNSTYAFYRTSSDGVENIVVVLNFTPVPREDYRVGVPIAGYYKEVLNSDAKIYGGSNVGNQGGVYSEPIACHGLEQSVSLTLPPLSVVAFRPIAGRPTPKAAAEKVPTGRRVTGSKEEK
ncbi:1,4-alpha-glucan branching protein GlgB [Calycomorphotria hydatis]|uniref:1,4-alpha-glucan branching enzyme GlgB n=1 Tax=Calycomorphotria hydatis TaxID=2528027 RepID=A0A517TC95_9PLAN|nr:1,4-alpha-glucan branching protein GlgB [Calycomorphotria hydatis]QDT65993.1 1,4-alpha-glucan branching enzyme GlgB [Calycomorphotria hydatis]